MTEKNYEVIHSNKLTQEMNSDRYIVVDTLSGEILADANGWGYLSKENARRAYEYMLNHGEKDMKQPSTDEEKQFEEYTAARVFLAKHPEIDNALLNAASYDTFYDYDENGGYTLSIHDMSDKKTERFSPAIVDRILAEYGYTDLDFSPYTLYKVFFKFG
ncbi:hypothetical protein AB9M75_10750 [Lactobacillus sp. AN1001]